VIFSRQRGKAGRHARSKDAGPVTRSGRRGSAEQDDALEASDAGPGWNDQTRVVRRVAGPYDVSTAPTDSMHRLDLGALLVPALPDVEVRVEAGSGGHIQQVVLVWGESALQVRAFAAPRTEGIWADVREDIRATRIAEGGQAVEINGEYGVELRVRISTPQGPMDLRYVGVDGPRWLALGIYQGAAADDPSAAGPLHDLFGDGAMPVREALPLRLPPELAAQAAEHHAAHEAEAARGTNGVNGAARTINGH
jgi:hypothetical protein